MPVVPSLPRKILVVHGVQTGEDADLDQHISLQTLVRNRLNGAPMAFETEIYRYEDVNDCAQKRLLDLLQLFRVNLATGKALDGAIDLIGDVVIALSNGSTASTIRKGLRSRIEDIHADGHPLYVVAHSLGSIYAFDVVNQLIKSGGYFERDDRKTWPVQGLVTLGSPIGLSMFRRNKVTPLGPGTKSKFLRWINYWDRTDPVVSGSFYGRPQEGYSIVERFATSDPDCGWLVRDRVVDVGQAWLGAHVGYWSNPGLGDDLVSLLG